MRTEPNSALDAVGHEQIEVLVRLIPRRLRWHPPACKNRTCICCDGTALYFLLIPFLNAWSRVAVAGTHLNELKHSLEHACVQVLMCSFNRGSGMPGPASGLPAPDCMHQWTTVHHVSATVNMSVQSESPATQAAGKRLQTSLRESGRCSAA